VGDRPVVEGARIPIERCMRPGGHSHICRANSDRRQQSAPLHPWSTTSLNAAASRLECCTIYTTTRLECSPTFACFTISLRPYTAPTSDSAPYTGWHMLTYSSLRRGRHTIQINPRYREITFGVVVVYECIDCARELGPIALNIRGRFVLFTPGGGFTLLLFKCACGHRP
jgi:hypothetical protein